MLSTQLTIQYGEWRLGLRMLPVLPLLLVWLGRNADTWTCRVVNIALSIISVSRPVLNQTVVAVWFTTAPGASRQLQTKAVCEEWGSGHAGRGRRAVSPCIHTGSNDAAFRWLSQCGRIVRGSFQETATRKTAEIAKLVNHHDGGESLLVVTTLLFLTTMTSVTCWRRCSSRFRCWWFSMSDVCIGRTLVTRHRRRQNLRVPKMESSWVDRRRLPVRSGYWSGRLGDRCVTGWPHKMQKYKPKSEIHLLQSLRFLTIFIWLKCGSVDCTVDLIDIYQLNAVLL